MKKRLIVMLLSIVVIISGMPMASLGAEKGSAKLIEMTGEVQIIRSGGEKPFKAFLNMKLTEGDRIITSSTASAKIKLDDEVVITLSENTSIFLSELRDSKGGKQSSINLQSGGVGSSIKKKLTDNSRFEIKTPTAVMGVRGTEFFAQYFNGNVDLRVVEGTVEVLVNLNRQGNITGISQDEINAYSYLVSALQQSNFKEGQSGRDLSNSVETLDLMGLPLPFLERIREIIKEDSNSIPKEMQETIEIAINDAVSKRENKADDKNLAPDEFSSKLANRGSTNIQESNPFKPLPQPEPIQQQQTLPEPIWDYTPERDWDPEPDYRPEPDTGQGQTQPDPEYSITVSGFDNATTLILEYPNPNPNTLQMIATILPSNADNQGVTWSIENDTTGSATIDSVGLLMAKDLGKVTVKATAQDGSGIFGTLVIRIKAYKTVYYSAQGDIEITDDSGVIFESSDFKIPDGVESFEFKEGIVAKKAIINEDDLDTTIIGLYYVAVGTVEITDGSGVTFAGGKFSFPEGFIVEYQEKSFTFTDNGQGKTAAIDEVGNWSFTP